MAQEVDVVALLKPVKPLVGSARLAPVQRRVRNGLRHVQLVSQFDRHEPLGIPPARLVVKFDVEQALLELRQFVAGRLHG